MKAHLLGSQTGDQVLAWQTWSDCVSSGECDWEKTQVWVRPSVMEKALNASSHACDSGSAPTPCIAVAPPSAESPIFGVQLANQRWKAKFDPFCDDLNDNGYCDCYAAGTTTLKEPSQCTLEDDSAEPTLSQAPYWLESPQASAFGALFNNLGGKRGGQFASALGQTFNGQYINNNQLFMDINNVFQCAYRKSGESHFRKPLLISWSNFDDPMVGCPASEGAATVTQGVVRLIKPVAANNTYAINRPNTLIKMINYATKTIGQGIKIGADEKVFTFDEALALVALRGLMPIVGEPVYAPGASSPSGTVLKGVVPTFRRVHLPTDNGGKELDISSAVLRAITRPGEL